MPTTMHHQNINGNGNGAATSIAINMRELVGAAFEPGASQWKFACALFVIGFLTLVMDLAICFNKPPGGVAVFESHKLAYYLTLAGVIAAGVAEMSIACWLSGGSSGETQDRHCATLAKTGLCCSVLPLVVVLALGGFSVLVKS